MVFMKLSQAPQLGRYNWRCTLGRELPNGVAARPYFSTLAFTGGDPGIPTTWSVVPNSVTLVETPLPPGLALHPSTGVIYGTPTTPGLYPFTMQAADATGHVNTQDLESRFCVLFLRRVT